MQYVVLDLEFNQPFNFSKGRQTVLRPACPFEIVQIGVVRLSEAFEILASANFYVKPQIYKRMHPYVEKITSINFKILKKAPVFKAVYADFMSFIGNDKTVFGVWGPSDVEILFKNISFHNLDTGNLPLDYIDIQVLAANYLNIPRDRTVSLKSAATELGLEADVPFHDAFNDAIYTAHVFKRVRNEEMHASTFNPYSVAHKEQAQQLQVNSRLLFAYAEKDVGRPLTDIEKSMVLNVYGAGKKLQFKKR